MGVAVLNPQDCLKDPFSRDNVTSPLMSYHRNPNPSRPKRQPANRRRKSPPRSLTNASPDPSPPRASTVVPKAILTKKSPQPVIGHVKILKRGEEIAKITPDLPSQERNLGTTNLESEKVKAPTQIRVTDKKLSPDSFYAGPVTFTSPPPSELPFPAFTRKTVSFLNNNDATNDLIRILRLDIS